MQISSTHKFLNRVAHDLGFHPTYDKHQWYTVTMENLKTRNGVHKALCKFGGSYRKAIVQTFKELGLDEKRFGNVSLNYHKAFFDEYAAKHGFHPTQEHYRWYGISIADLRTSGGSSVLSAYKGLLEALTALYPLVTFMPSKFANANGKWKSELEAQREFFDHLAHTLGFHPTEESDRWYSVTFKDVASKKGGSAISILHGGHRKAIIATYPECSLDITKFNLWKGNVGMQVQLFNTIAHEFGFHPIEESDNWQNVSPRDVSLRRGSTLLKAHHGSLVATLYSIYPTVVFSQPFSKIRQTRQKHLLSIVKGLFGQATTEIIHNARKVTSLYKNNTGKRKGYYFELDIWLPELKLGFEYQDPHHYVTQWYTNDTLQEIQRNDLDKKRAMEAKQITLVEVPCWWDGKANSLAASIREQRLDLLTDYVMIGTPIPSFPPIGFFASSSLPEVGELMLPTFIVGKEILELEASTWWMGEKFDGVRACWHSFDQKMYSRSGNPLNLPVSTTMPCSTFLDGELWGGRGNFICTMCLPLNRHTENVQWHLIRFIVFDDPNPYHQHQQTAYECRYKSLLRSILYNHPCTIVTPRVKCTSSGSIEMYTMELFRSGSEGAMFRKCGSHYENGRSLSVLKYKTFRDGEALVEQIRGAYYTCKLPNGEVFVTTKSKDMAEEILVGDIISFKYANISQNLVPSSTIIYRLRLDLSWTQLQALEYNDI